MDQKQIDVRLAQLEHDIHNASMGSPDKWMRHVLLRAPEMINMLIAKNDALLDELARVRAERGCGGGKFARYLLGLR